jgi:hypothetical protein
MRNQKGNVIALVLLLLAVVSLVAAGALLISRQDMKFTAASKGYDRTFNVADGAATTAWRDLGTKDREGDTKFTDPSNPPKPFTIACHCKGSFADPSLCTGSARSTCTRCVDKSQGDYDVKLQLLGYVTQTKPGWEQGGYYEEMWDGNGYSSPTYTQTANSNVEVCVEKTKSSR